MSAADDGFGAYFGRIAERDVDMLLLEEFHVDGSFVEWFSNQVGLSGADFEGAWQGVTNGDGESDLVLRVRSKGRRIGVLIENKIAAVEQPDQPVRYHIRAESHRKDGMFDDYAICICAPAAYLEKVGAQVTELKRQSYQHRIRYEAIADWFAGNAGPRNMWRSKFLHAAIDQAHRPYMLVENIAVTRFHKDYRDLLQSIDPSIDMPEPGKKGSQSNWILMKGPDFPKGVHLSHKVDLCVVELGFDSHQRSELTAIRADWPEGILPIQKGSTATLSLRVPWVDITKSVNSQRDLLLEVFAAVEKLKKYGRVLQQDGRAEL